MDIQHFKQFNITFLYEEPINHANINLHELEEALKSNKSSEYDLSNKLEVTGNYKILSYPGRKIDVIFEQERILINDNSGQKKEAYSFLDYIDNVFTYSSIVTEKIKSFGFNITAEAINNSSDTFINPTLEKKLNVKIEQQGLLFVFSKDGLRYQMQINPTSQKNNSHIIQCNIHHEKFSNITDMSKHLNDHINYFNKLIRKI